MNNTNISDTEEERRSPKAEGPGQRLRALREAENLALSRVSVLLHLKEEMLTALEADDYAKLPGPVFVQGYLRNYARLLGVPVEPVLNAYHAASPESSRIPELKITQVSHQVGSGHLLVRLVTWSIAIGLILLSVVWWRGYLEWPMQVSMSPEEEVSNQTGLDENESQETDADQTFPEVEVNEDGAVTLTLPQARPEPSMEAGPSDTSNQRNDANRLEQQVEPTGNAPTGPAVEPASTRAEQPATAAVAGTEQVVIEFSGASWTKIEDASGTLKIEGSNNAGSRRVLRGVPPYRMVLGNAGAVKIFVNGREFDLTPYNRGNVARFTLDPERAFQ